MTAWCESETGRCDVFGNETFWLNVVNAAFGVAAAAAVLAVLVATVLEIAGRARHPR